jgi:CRP-like cAMP-binding protein
MSEHFGNLWKTGAVEVREFLGVIKKAPPPVLNRLNEIAAEINELEASKAKDEESLRNARDVIERAQQIITNAEERARLRELQLAALENERKTVLLVVTAYETIPHASTPDQTCQRKDVPIVTILSQSDEPLTRQQIADRLPSSTIGSISTRLSQLRAKGLIKKSGGKRWQLQ